MRFYRSSDIIQRMKLLDLFCGAGGCAMGYFRAGFADIVGIDIKSQPRYPFKFVKGDALEYVAEHGREFDLIHASPPCQAYSVATSHNRRAAWKAHSDLVVKTREILLEIGKPFVIENVENAPLEGLPLFGPHLVLLCGSMFSLDVRRHRLFETSIAIPQPECRHSLQLPRFRTLDSRRKGALACVVGVHGHINYAGEAELRKAAMGIDWMNNEELNEAIPPAYCEFIGKALLPILNQAATTSSSSGIGASSTTD